MRNYCLVDTVSVWDNDKGLEMGHTTAQIHVVPPECTRKMVRKVNLMFLYILLWKKQW